MNKYLYSIIAASVSISGISSSAMAQQAVRGHIRSQTVTEQVTINPQNTVEKRGPCCPPITSKTFSQYFQHQQSPGKDVTQTFGWNFVATPALDSQMNAYAPFAALWTPANHVANSVALVAEVRTWPTPIAPTNWNAPGFTDVYPGKKQLRAWWTSGGVWTGGNFEKTLWDNQAIAPNHFKPNQSYMIRLSLVLNYKTRADDNSWFQLPLTCMEKFVRQSSLVSGKVAAGGSAPVRLEDF